MVPPPEDDQEPCTKSDGSWSFFNTMQVILIGYLVVFILIFWSANLVSK